MFHDLRVKIENHTPDKVINDILTQCVEYGYRVVALSYECHEDNLCMPVGKKKTLVPQVPPPRDVSQFRIKFPKLKIYTRINIVLRESELINRLLQSKHIREYDLISFQPLRINVLKSLINTPDVDIISYSPEEKQSFSVTRKLYNQFVSQNVYFELPYVSAMISDSSRKNLIALSHIYHAVGRSKNIIVSSGGFAAHHIRGPYDVINFNLLFGLNEEQAKKAISGNCEKVLLRARRQRLGKGMVEISVDIPEEENEAEKNLDMETTCAEAS